MEGLQSIFFYYIYIYSPATFKENPDKPYLKCDSNGCIIKTVGHVSYLKKKIKAYNIGNLGSS